MREGLTEGRPHLRALTLLAQETLNAIGDASAKDLPIGKDEWSFYREAAQQAVKKAIAGARVIPERKRETNLSKDLLRYLPTAGALRIDVVAAMRGVYRPRAIERCARRIGVKEVMSNRGRLWLPPDGISSLVRPPRRPQTALPTKNDRHRKVRFALVAFLEKHPEGVSVKKVVSHLTAIKIDDLPIGRSLIYEEAERANVQRFVTGFGVKKQSVWKMPKGSTDEE